MLSGNPSWGKLYSVDFLNSTTGVVAGDSGHILLTSNGGVSWQSAPEFNFDSLRAVSMPDANTIYAAGLEGAIRKSTDGGVNWSVAMNANSRDWYALDFISPTQGGAAGFNIGNNLYMRTANGGSGVSSSNHADDIDMITYDNIFQVNSENVIWHTLDATTWVPESVNGAATNASFTGVDFPTPNLGFAVGATWGRCAPMRTTAGPHKHLWTGEYRSTTLLITNILTAMVAG